MGLGCRIKGLGVGPGALGLGLRFRAQLENPALHQIPYFEVEISGLAGNSSFTPNTLLGGPWVLLTYGIHNASVG